MFRGVGAAFILYVFNVKDAFYFSAAEPRDWTSPQNNNLWQDTVKTLFDPCPAGWRVPQGGGEASGRSPWSAFTADNGPYQDGEKRVKGRLWDRTVCYGGTAWYPVTGERYSSTGLFYNANNGSNWTTTSQGAMAHYLYFNDVYINIYGFTASGYYRAYGFPVRCIRE